MNRDEYSSCCDAPTRLTAPNKWGNRHYVCTKCGTKCQAQDGLAWWHQRPGDGYYPTIEAICTDFCRDIDWGQVCTFNADHWLAMTGALLLLAVCVLKIKPRAKHG